MKKLLQDLAAPGSIPGSGIPGGGFLNQLTEGIRSFKDALQLIKEIREIPGQASGIRGDQAVMDNEPGKQPFDPKIPQLPPPSDPIREAIALFEVLDQAGYGDKTIGQLIQDISPFTVKQAKGVLEKNARLNR